MSAVTGSLSTASSSRLPAMTPPRTAQYLAYCGRIPGAHHLFWYCSTDQVWQTPNIRQSPRVASNLVISGAVHGQTSEHCSEVLCQTLLVLQY